MPVWEYKQTVSENTTGVKLSQFWGVILPVFFFLLLLKLSDGWWLNLWLSQKLGQFSCLHSKPLLAVNKKQSSWCLGCFQNSFSTKAKVLKKSGQTKYQQAYNFFFFFLKQMKAKCLQTKCDINDWFGPIGFDINFQQGIWTGVDDLWKMHLEQNISATDIYKNENKLIHSFRFHHLHGYCYCYCYCFNIPYKQSTANQWWMKNDTGSGTHFGILHTSNKLVQHCSAVLCERLMGIQLILWQSKWQTCMGCLL